MLAAVIAGAGHPAVAGLLGIGAAGLAGGVVAMAWSVHTRQLQLAEHLARRQFIVTAAGEPAAQAAESRAAAATVAGAPLPESLANGSGRTPVIIEGPDTVVAGEQARFRVRSTGSRKVMAWSAGGGAVAHAPDPAHPDDLLLTADEPGSLTVSVRVRDGMMESRGTKTVTAVQDVTTVTTPFPLRLFLQGWGLIVVGVLVVGFAGALAALGSLTSAEFIALAAPLAALVGVVAVVHGCGEPGSHPGVGPGKAPPRS